MKALLFLTVVLLGITSCGPTSSPEKRMNIKNDELEQKVELISKQQQVLKDSILILKREIDSIKFK
ncbi:MAG: hypothetical protein EOP48_13085 [Sphingobacteriales bacterium]|nr:MAG: hypothetical protein EOP48_13085 [Sphingobacteriales bacterium]